MCLSPTYSMSNSMFWKKYILPVIILFSVVNISIVIASFEGWFPYDFNKVVLFALFFVKIAVLAGITKLLLALFDLGDHPLVLAGLVMSIIAVLLSGTAITDFQRAYFQKQSIGGAVEISNSSTIEIDKLLKTPYLQVINSGIGAIRTVRIQTGTANNGTSRDPVYTTYCYTRLKNVPREIRLYEKCDGKNEHAVKLKALAGKAIISGQLLDKRNRVEQKDHIVQLDVAEETFQEYFQAMTNGFKTLLIVVNAIALVFASVFLVLRKRLK